MNDEYPLPPYLYITVCSAGEVTEAYVFPNQESEKTYKGAIKIVDGINPEFRILKTYEGPLNGVVVDFGFVDELLTSSLEEILCKLEERRKICPEYYTSETISQIREVKNSTIKIK